MRVYGLLILAVFLAAPLVAAADDPTVPWSNPVQGLRARIFTLPSTDPGADKTYDVWLELQEVGIETSLGVQHHAVSLHYASDSSELQMTVTSPTGDAITSTDRPANEAVTSRDLVIPPHGTLTFPIGAGGISPHQVPLGQPFPKGRLLSFTFTTEWLIPNDGGPYRLAATLEIPDVTPEPGAPPYRGWTGSMELPAIELPLR